MIKILLFVVFSLMGFSGFSTENDTIYTQIDSLREYVVSKQKKVRWRKHGKDKYIVKLSYYSDVDELIAKQRIVFYVEWRPVKLKKKINIKNAFKPSDHDLFLWFTIGAFYGTEEEYFQWIKDPPCR